MDSNAPQTSTGAAGETLTTSVAFLEAYPGELPELRSRVRDLEAELARLRSGWMTRRDVAAFFGRSVRWVDHHAAAGNLPRNPSGLFRRADIEAANPGEWRHG